LDLPEFSPLDLFYPFALFLVAGAFWSVLKLRSEMRSALWFALAFASSGMAFCAQFFRHVAPDAIQALLGAGFYNAMAACFVMGIILRAGRKPPQIAIFSIAALSTLSIVILTMLNVHVLIRVCLTLLTASLLLMIALVFARQRIATHTDKAVLGIIASLAVLLFVQPLIVNHHVGLFSMDMAYDASVLFLNFGALTAVFSVLIATLLVREYVMVIINDLKNIAAKDKLTDISNRRGFEDSMPQLIEYAKAQNRDICFIVLDIDHFKAVNDTYGHGFGDDIIMALARLLAAHKSPEGLAVRLGGEEFLLAMPVSSLDEACTMAELIRERWSRRHHYCQTEDVRCTASFGVSMLRQGEPISAALARADQALYGAKKTGRNKVKSEEDLQVAKLNFSASQMRQANEGHFSMSGREEQAAKETS